MYEALSRMSGFECKQGVRDRRPRPSLARRAPSITVQCCSVARYELMMNGQPMQRGLHATLRLPTLLANLRWA